jgi:hypothetical protein
MTAIEAKEMENTGTEAVKKLRINDLQKGIPFMINSNDLPPRQCYMEYPDGTIKLVTIAEGSTKFVTVKVLSQIEAAIIRKKFDLVAYA